jgi:hypothetical protein
LPEARRKVTRELGGRKDESKSQHDRPDGIVVARRTRRLCVEENRKEEDEPDDERSDAV